MTDSFEKWINGMTEEQYEDWLEDTATEAQEEKALNIRQPLSEDEEDDILAQQGQQPVIEPPREIEMPQPREVYDNRDLPPKVIPARVIIEEGKPPVVQQVKPSIASRIFKRNQPARETPRPTITPTPQKKQNIFRRFLGIFRRRNK